MIVSPLKSLALAVACAAASGALQAQERQAPQYQVCRCPWMWGSWRCA